MFLFVFTLIKLLLIKGVIRLICAMNFKQLKIKGIFIMNFILYFIFYMGFNFVSSSKEKKRLKFFAWRFTDWNNSLKSFWEGNNVFFFFRHCTEAYWEPSWTSRTELSAKLVNGFQQLTIFAKSSGSILDVQLGSKYTSDAKLHKKSRCNFLSVKIL